jgi:hypothetical protein
MEHSVRAADRVLVICTDQYVRKANEGRGGAGYERMVMTAELIRDQDTTKFIPVVRQASSDKPLPDFMGTRLFIDLRANDEEEFGRLLRELLSEPLVPKPPIGRNPFSPLTRST